jgi:hypothetical protein
VEHLKGVSTLVGFFLTHRHYTILERLAGGEQSSLLRKFITYGRKKFYYVGPRTFDLGTLAHPPPLYRHQGPYSKHFISFVTYKWAQSARVLFNTKLERFDKDKYSSLGDPFISYEENEVLLIRPLVTML